MKHGFIFTHKRKATIDKKDKELGESNNKNYKSYLSVNKNDVTKR